MSESNYSKRVNPDAGAAVHKDEGAIEPYLPVTARNRKIAQQFAHGKTNNEICATMDMDPSRISILKNNPKMQILIAEYQDRIFEASLDESMKELGPDAMAVIRGILKDPNISLLKKESVAKWLTEKLTGKATQAIDVRGEISVGVFLDQLETMKIQNKTIDVTPKLTGESGKPGTIEAEPEKADVLDTWLDGNL